MGPRALSGGMALLAGAAILLATGARAQDDLFLKALRDDPAYSLRKAAEQPMKSYFPSPADWGTEVVYQVITDRFDNGDPSNDGANPRGKPNPANKNGIHGGDYAGLKKRLPYMKELGVTAIWISPVQLNADAQYHGYATYDFSAVDPHWGTLAELQDFIAEAHKNGMYVIIDIICNHTADLVTADNDREYKAPPDSYLNRWKDERRYPPPFDTLAAFHSHGKINYDIEQSIVLGDLYSLDDLRTEDPVIRAELIRVFKDLITATDCDGYRVDTVKHVENGFWNEWCPAIHEHAKSLGKDRFLIFGEAWVDSTDKLNSYLQDEWGKPVFDSLIDFPMMYAAGDVFAKNTAGGGRIRKLEQDQLKKFPEHAKGRMMRFLDNHDMKRFLSTSAESQPDESIRHARLRMALLYHLTSGGIPIIYYGTEQVFGGPKMGKDWDSSREDMFDGENEHGASEGDNFNTTHPMFLHTQALLRLRAEHPALQTGITEWIYTPDSPDIFVYKRTLGEDSILVMMNQGEQSAVAPAALAEILGEKLPALFPNDQFIDPREWLVMDMKTGEVLLKSEREAEEMRAGS